MPRRISIVLLALVLAGVAAPAASALDRVQVPGLQVALYRKGFYKGPIDGLAGPLTRKAVVAFQKSVGLEPDGVPGSKTRAALGRYGKPLFGSRTIRRGMVGYDVSVLQFLLAKRGFPPKRLNSNFGPSTEELVKRFQKRAGIAADGVVGRLTRAALVAKSGKPPKTLLRPAGEARTRSLSSRDAVRASLNKWSRRYGVDPELARALAWQESGFQNSVRSSAGAFGVMQVTPATWEFVETVLIGDRVSRNVDGNVRVGVRYLRHLVDEFNGSERRALGAYYQGPASVKRRGLMRETKVFVANVLALKGRV